VCSFTHITGSCETWSIWNKSALSEEEKKEMSGYLKLERAKSLSAGEVKQVVVDESLEIENCVEPMDFYC